MRTPLAFLKFVAKAGLNAISGGVAGDFVAEFLPDFASEVWAWWSKGRTQEQLRAEVQALAQLPPDEARRQAEQAIAEVGAGQPPEVRDALAAYLVQIPATIRQSQRRPTDPTGHTLDIHLSLCQPQDLLPLLPAKRPHFQPGDRPAGIGDWELEELLGVGGFSEVWKARNPHLGECAALKFCLDASAARVLRNEAALLGRVMSQGKHPGIVRLLHTYLGADPPCLEYEYVPGGDLARLIAEWHHTPAADLLERSLRLMRELVDVVAFAHRLDPPIVHRDLKPANILLQPLGDGRVALRVADFGIGGLAQRTLAQASLPTVRNSLMLSVLRGAHTPLYASPQQMMGHAPDPRDDVHALGVIWYQLLTGNRSILSMPAEWQDELAERQVPDLVVRLLRSCLTTQPERRLASAAVLADELDRLLQQTPTEGYSPPHAAGPATDLAVQVRHNQLWVRQAHARARDLAERAHDYPAATRVLEEMPAHLRDLELYEHLCCQRDRAAHLDAVIRDAVQEMRYVGLRRGVEELLRLTPQRDDLRRLLEALPAEEPLPRTLANSLGMRLVLIPAGTFPMGSPRTEAERHGNEGLPHPVTIEEPFYLCMYPVTQAEYTAVMGRNPSCFFKHNGGGPDHPVEQVSWDDAVEFCHRLTDFAREKAARRTYRLPTEAEWEYACRAGTATPFSFGSSASSTQANFNGHYPYGGAHKGPYRGHTSPVGSYDPNPWGLHDMHGNVWEWCSDLYHHDPSAHTPARSDALVARDRVLRGGCWFSDGGLCRSACRLGRPAFEHDFNVGFRVALDVPPALQAIPGLNGLAS
jgi:formylglycine-generating enzyme required for sulfatase activity